MTLTPLAYHLLTLVALILAAAAFVVAVTSPVLNGRPLLFGMLAIAGIGAGLYSHGRYLIEVNR